MENGFQEAKQDLEFRAEYVRSVDLENMRRYVGRIDYNPKQGFTVWGRPDLMICFKLEDGSGLSRIEVYPKAFDYCQSEDDFKSVLIDHEGRHAQQWYFAQRWNLCEELNLPSPIDILILCAIIHARYKGEGELIKKRLDIASHIIFDDAELAVLTYQLFRIERGKRKVSGQFRRDHRRDFFLFNFGRDVRKGKRNIHEFFDLLDSL